jgi:hypothetical protein
MARFSIQNIEDNSVIEIIAMNIDNENNILAQEDSKATIITISDFKDMVLGTLDGKVATYKIIE